MNNERYHHGLELPILPSRLRQWSPMLKRLLLAVLVAASIAPAVASDSVLIAAGAGYRRPVLDLIQAFTTATGIKAEASFGNMKQVEIQAKQNPDISLLLGDRVFIAPMQLAQRFEHLGSGQLVLVTSKNHALKSIADLSKPEFKRIAVPDRVKAVYGKAAFTCLERNGLASSLQPRLLEVATVPQVGSYLATGEVDAGFVNKTEAMALQGKTGSSVPMPADCHDPIELSLAVIDGRDSGAATRAFVEFVGTPEARAVLQRHGL